MLFAATSSRIVNSPCAVWSSDRITSLRSSTLISAALAPAPPSRDAVFFPAITRESTPILKKLMNFSCCEISERAAAIDLGFQLVHRTLSQSSVISPENWQGREISGVVIRENNWTNRFPTLRWSAFQLNGLFTICRSTPLSFSSLQ